MIYFIVLGGAVLVTIVVAVLYALRKAKQKDNGSDPKTNIANTGWRIVITILLINAIFRRYPLVIFTNLTRNSFYMMAYENFTTTSCPCTGVFDERIVHGASSMHPDDQELFATTFNRQRLIDSYKSGTDTVRLITRQLGDGGIYRRVETVDYFVKSNYSEDILAITLCENLPDETEMIGAIEENLRKMDELTIAAIMSVIRKHLNTYN